MLENPLTRIVLFPLSLIYGLIMFIRSLLYRFGLLKSVKFGVPVISVGNLSVGGTGKTPHTALILQLLTPYMPLATLSRGYGRKKGGFRFVESNMDTQWTGDEALLLKYKFPSAVVAVGEDRATAIPLILGQYPEVRTVVLDDAFQHRAVTPYINILLTTYDRPYYKDWLIPTGSLREWPSAHDRADIIIMTKCPADMTATDRVDRIKRLEPHHQSIYFTRYIYGAPYNLWDYRERFIWSAGVHLLLVTGLADSSYLMEYLHEKVEEIHHFEFGDHHEFTEREVGQMKRTFDELNGDHKLIVLTTEKDAVRLLKHQNHLRSYNLPLYVLPIAVDFLFDEKEVFAKEIQSRLLEFKS